MLTVCLQRESQVRMYPLSFHSFPILVTHFLDTVCAKDAYPIEAGSCFQAEDLLTTICLPDFETVCTQFLDSVHLIAHLLQYSDFFSLPLPTSQCSRSDGT